jgi:hypothetical protein
MQRLEQALAGLEEALSSPPVLQQPWRHLVRERLNAVSDALRAERPAATDSWLAGRVGSVRRERDRLLTRLVVLRSTVLDVGDVEGVRQRLQRLTLDLHHHQQRINDLAYDAVGMEVGGSE